MFKGRRVGTFTAGIVLVVFGVMFLLHTFFPFFDYNFIFSLWPVILILLGFEIIISYVINDENKLRYDAGAIALTIILGIFAMTMGGMQYVLEHAKDIGCIIRI
ncbi:putative membrane protein [[Clostridium] cellulosi]|uniref:Putative membrane protein n=1 Tax=[Clostridium] cellulosi TaxID=29343 RepID=A0A078KLV0_9FIRM|nr:putative membrane protein [[Clostridium] cellulosi]